MINSKETLKRLHKKFPLLDLNELFDILDCYVEDSFYTFDPNKLWYTTTGKCQTDAVSNLKDVNIKLHNNGNLGTITTAGSVQLASNH